MLKIFISTWYIWALIIILQILIAFIPKIKGIFGEKETSAILSFLDPNKYKIINNIVLDLYGRTTQIDHIVVSNYGVFVIETKNYSGWIYGDEKSEYWTQVIYKKKSKFYNPIRQNYGHIAFLKEKLMDFENINFIPIIVFSVNADLKVKCETSVIYSVNLLKTIKSYNTETIVDEEKDNIFNRIMDLNINNRKVMRNHISAIEDRKLNYEREIKNDVCPRCGGRLIVRKGRYGYFKGCSNFPQCRFTRKI